MISNADSTLVHSDPEDHRLAGRLKVLKVDREVSKRAQYKASRLEEGS